MIGTAAPGETGDALSRAPHEDRLRRLAESGAGRIDLAEAALALAALDRPRVALDRYRQHLGLLVRDVAAASDAGSGPAAALATTLAEQHGYQGDNLTYDDPQNANLMRVIDRRRGLPVALGILYIHDGRAQGWEVAGLGFPGHFLVRIQHRGERAVIDPFNGGRRCGAAELRELLKATGNAEAELEPQHYDTVPDREILVRLQNNIKLRLVQQKQPGRALGIIRTMLLFAPERPQLWYEAGVIEAHEGNLRAATKALDECLARTTSDAMRHEAARLLQKLKGALH
jgi:regulator of sirC expression with transglutaminase-like and TPR domain